jgi:hypothetical protein
LTKCNITRMLMVRKLNIGRGKRLVKIAQAQSLFVVKIAHFGTLIWSFYFWLFMQNGVQQ